MVRGRRWIAAAGFAVWLLAAAGAAAAASYDYYRVGAVEAPTPARVEPGLLLLGGGDWPLEAFRWFAERAGHGHLVALAASGSDDLQQEIFHDVGGFASVETIVFHDRSAASDPAVLAIVRRADAVFFRGGDQSNYVRDWQGTPLAAALDAHARAGRPIGGTSAGLAILGSVVYGAMDGGSLTSTTALADPYDPAVTLVADFLHLPFLEHVITDSHFAKRRRLGRLITWVTRLASERHDEALVGLGVDEGTGLVVDGQGLARFYPREPGYAWLVRPRLAGARAVAGAALEARDLQITGIGPGSRLDLRTLAVADPAFDGTISAAAGALHVSGGHLPPGVESLRLESPGD
ncbi:MAG: cyanophycinase [Proteobacteria bacterium]|nr:cyanophycinase [Pseudomonadota bacterium]